MDSRGRHTSGVLLAWVELLSKVNACLAVLDWVEEYRSTSLSGFLRFFCIEIMMSMLRSSVNGFFDAHKPLLQHSFVPRESHGCETGKDKFVHLKKRSKNHETADGYPRDSSPATRGFSVAESRLFRTLCILS